MAINKELVVKKINALLTKHRPALIIGMQMVAAEQSIRLSMDSARERNSPSYQLAMYRKTGDEYYKIRYMQLTRSNNWLKMHGYPMRRKIKV